MVERHRQPADEERDLLQVDEGLHRRRILERAVEGGAQTHGAGDGLRQSACGKGEGLHVERVHRGHAAHRIRRPRFDRGLRPRAQRRQEGRGVQQAAGELPAHIGRADEVADRTTHRRGGERAAAARRLERAGAAERDVHRHCTDRRALRGVLPVQSLAVDVEVVGAGEIVHRAGRTQQTRRLLDRAARDLDDRAAQARFHIHGTDRLTIERER